MSTSVNARKTRKQKAAETRERMLAAATAVFIDAGFTGARMSDIAERAGVAVQTLYFTFHTKVELLQECFHRSVMGPEALPPQEQLFYGQITRARSARAALAAFVRGNTAILDRSAAIKEVAEMSADPEALAVVENSEQLRRDGYAEVLRIITDHFPLRRGLDRQAATDLLMMFGSTSTYLTLRRYGWDNDRYTAWLADTLTAQLFDQSSREPTHRRRQLTST